MHSSGFTKISPLLPLLIVFQFASTMLKHPQKVARLLPITPFSNSHVSHDSSPPPSLSLDSNTELPGFKPSLLSETRWSPIILPTSSNVASLSSTPPITVNSLSSGKRLQGSRVVYLSISGNIYSSQPALSVPSSLESSFKPQLLPKPGFLFWSMREDRLGIQWKHQESKIVHA